MNYKQLASYGRNGDTELMHVSKDEVRTLQGLGALTTNPVTGLPEAFQLSDLMPLLGVGASLFAGPLAGAAVSGLGTAFKTHSLGQGLMSGLASWGMGSLLSGAGSTGSSAASDVAATAGPSAAAGTPGAAGFDAAQGAAYPGTGAPNTAFDPGYGSMANTGASPMQMGEITSGAGAQGGASYPGNVYGGMQNGTWNAGNLQNNLSSGSYWSGAGKMPGIAAGVGLYGLSAMQEQTAQAAAANALNASNAAKIQQENNQYAAAAGQAHMVNPYNTFYQPTSPYVAPYATGGLTGDSGLYGLHAHQPLIADKMHSTYGAFRFDGGGQTNEYQNAQNFGQQELQAKLLESQGMAGGGYTAGDNGRYDPRGAGALHDGNGVSGGGIEGLLKGPGDGMSDHIPATIEGHTPARLANDEFVVPADVVSHLGNGSTSAGAKHLYDMLDRVRKARVGHTKQGKEIDPHEHLPA